VIEGPQGTVTLDARPSDAIALALGVSAPIKVDRTLFDTHAQAGERTGQDREGAREVVARFREMAQRRR
jgi:bifunctional DNase/RNase